MRVAGYRAIAEVGTTLVDLLIEADENDSTFDDKTVKLASPAAVDPDGHIRITFYLYDVSVNGHMQNQQQPFDAAEGSRSGEPVYLDLRYLMTAYPTRVSGGSDDTADEHEVLGRAIQILQDNRILTGPTIGGTFLDNETVHLSIDPDGAEQSISIWNTFDERPYLPSVVYLATPVIIESDESTDESPVHQREQIHHVPDHSGAFDG